MEITREIELSQLIDVACLTSEKLFENEEFLVKDLFKGYEWKRIMNSKRLIGRGFYNYALKNPEKIEVLEKTPQKQQRYRKI